MVTENVLSFKCFRVAAGSGGEAQSKHTEGFDPLNGSVATTVGETGSSLGGVRSTLADAQQCPKYPRLPQQIVPGNSQNLTFANHMNGLDPFN